MGFTHQQMMEFHKQTSIGIMGVSENGRDTIEKMGSRTALDM